MKEQENTIVYGKNAVTERLKSGAGVDTVYLAEGMAPATASYYTALARQAGAVVKRVHTAKLRALCGSEAHQGVAAFASALEYASVEEILALAAQRGEDPFLLLADAGLSRADWTEKKPHLSASHCGALARDVRAGALLLTHLNPLYDPQALLDEARRDYPAAELARLGERYRV